MEEMKIPNLFQESTSDFFNPQKHIIKDGLIHCKVCGEPLEIRTKNGGKVRLICSCIEKQHEKEKQKERERQRKKLVLELKDKSLLGKRFVNASFKDIDKDHNKNYLEACKRCQNYCSKSYDMLENGYGIYIYGSCGGGKTWLTACMVNELVEKLHTVLFTNFAEISRAIRNTYDNSNQESENSIIEEIKNVDFLFIDDFGTEVVKRGGEDNWLQEKIYDIINNRYINLKPIIFSSNYSIDELKDRGLMGKTIDRVGEMSTAIFHIQEKNFRVKGKEVF